MGVKGFQLFQVGTGIPKGPVNYGSPQHHRLLEHAAKEADRLGLGFEMHNCPGWSSTGGPWITPELSMQQLVWTESSAEGGKAVNLTLPRPYAKRGYYRDAFVLAFPTVAGENRSMQDSLSRASSSSGPVDIKLLTNGDLAGGIEVHPAGAGQPAFLQFEFAEPFGARSIVAYVELHRRGRGGPPPVMTLEASDNGSDYRKVCDIPVPSIRANSLEVPATATFPFERAKYFRLALEQEARVAEVRLSGAARIDEWPVKAGYVYSTSRPEGPAAVAPGDSVIDPATVIDITQHMDPDGRLNWQAPAGDWTILRLGHTSIGIENHPAPDGGGGLECDKYSRAAMDYHFEHFFGKLFEMMGPLAAKGMAGALIDSYEVGMQTWTPEFPQEFQKRRGYDPRNYLPAMVGRLVGSADISDRFLWDVRRTQADLMADNYYGRFSELCRQHKMIAYTEPYDGGPFEEMQAGSRVDIPMGEFWIGGGDRNDLRRVKLATSVAHVSGKPIVGAESYTGRPAQAKWQAYPFAMKAQGDWMYTLGLNRVHLPPLRAAAASRRRAGHDHGPMGLPFRPYQHLVRKGQGLAGLRHPLPAHAAARPLCRGPGLLHRPGCSAGHAAAQRDAAAAPRRATTSTTWTPRPSSTA